MLEEQLFTRRQPCVECGMPLHEGENWGCAHAFVPVIGLPMAVELHQHIHIRCATGAVKWLALGALGRARLGAN